MASSNINFSAFSSHDVSGLKQAKQEWSKRLLTADANFVFSASSARALIVNPQPDKNVVGIGIGEKISEGISAGVLAVKFFVKRKIPKAQLSKSNTLPETIDGLPVDVEETGTFRAFAMPNPKQKIRPAQPGCSIGFADPNGQTVMAGTFGAVVKKNNKTYILSNNHVIADENQLPLNSPIFQAGLLDGGKTATDKIAVLSQVVHLLPGVSNKVDAAIAQVTKQTDVSNAVLFIGAPKGSKKAEIDMNVHKFGRTTSYTVGRVISIDTDVKVGYDTGEYTFTEQIIIVDDNGNSFSDSGDSGSLILERSSQKAVGLLFAGSRTHTIANQIGDVLKVLKVKLA